MNWRMQYEFAGHLADAKGSAVAAAGEVRWRAAISRVYYAVFSLARKRLTEVGQRFDPGQVHVQVRAKVVDHCSRLGLDYPVARDAAQDLRLLHKLRLRADYDPKPVTAQDLQRAMRLAASVATVLGGTSEANSP